MVVYFSLGTNLGDKEQNLRMAVQKIRKQIGEVISLSAFYATAPWGFSSDNTFLNAALCVDTALAPLEVLQTTQEIEREMGRTHKSVNAVYSDRVIDIDLLLCFADDGTPVLLDTPELKLPHPLMQERRFVMEPLAEIASGVVHPVLGKTIGELLQNQAGPPPRGTGHVPISCGSQVHPLLRQIALQLFQGSAVPGQDGGQGKTQVPGDLPVLQAGGGVKQHHLPLFLTQRFEGGLQHQPVGGV